MTIGSGRRIKQTQSIEDEVHSNGTVQDSHLIPFSSVLSLAWRDAGHKTATKVEKVFG
jgi:hypothetical protein